MWLATASSQASSIVPVLPRDDQKYPEPDREAPLDVDEAEIQTIVSHPFKIQRVVSKELTEEAEPSEQASFCETVIAPRESGSI